MVSVEINDEGLKELLKSPEIKSELMARAYEIKDRCPSASVKPNMWESRNEVTLFVSGEDAMSNELLRALR